MRVHLLPLLDLLKALERTMDDEIRRDPEREVGYGIIDTWDEMVEDMLLMSGQLNMLRRDRRVYARTARLMETVARLSREAWIEIGELRAVDRRRQTHLTEALTLMRTLQTQKMASKRTTRSTPATTTTPTTSVTDEQLKRLIDQGVVDALATRDADRSRNGEDSHDSGTGGTEGVIELTQWFKRMETVFRISNCSMENQIKFATCTLLESALTWWNSHVKTVGHDVALAMTWTNLKKKMTDKYCPRGEIKKLEVEMWNLKVKGTDVDAIEFATKFMDKKIRTFAKR
ncbi:putative reverse transcriptase domain-containing protein [Tanacetum coccineum]